MSLGDDSDFTNEIDLSVDGTDDCPTCSGTGQEYNGDVLVGDCPSCEGSGLLDT